MMLGMNRLALFLGIGFLSFSMTASAYTVRGTPDCQEWQSDNSDQFWVMGYISGRNAALNETLTTGLDMEEVYQYVTQFCKANPKMMPMTPCKRMPKERLWLAQQPLAHLVHPADTSRFR